MSDCCEGGGKARKTVLLYACSGGANVAELADRTCRELMFAGEGSMFCLAGLAAGIEEMVQTARGADMSLVVDGCQLDCARKVVERLGLENCRFLRVTDLGVAKKKGVRASQEELARVEGSARALLHPGAPTDAAPPAP